MATFRVLFLVLALAMVFTACGDDDDDNQIGLTNDDDPTATATTEPPAATTRPNPTTEPTTTDDTDDDDDNGDILSENEGSFVVPYGSWSDWQSKDNYGRRAVKMFPDDTIPNTGTYQLATELDQGNGNPWTEGDTYVYQLPDNTKVVYLGTQGDAAVMLCQGGDQVFMRTDGSNGTSAIVEVVESDEDTSGNCH